MSTRLFVGNMSRTHAAEALRRAIHLARGDGLLDDAEDTELWQGSVPNKDEARGDVIYWGSDRALIFGDSTDSFATYGRCPAQGPTLTLGKTEAMVKYAGSWDKHIHLGVKSHVPKAPISKVVSAAEEWVLTEPSYPHFSGSEPSGDASRKVVANALPSRKHSKTPVKLWLVDTGCGNDLVGRQEIKSVSNLLRKAPEPMAFHTANGITHATHTIPIRVGELEEVVEPWVLANSPAVVSVGRRCMHEGYSFIWLSAQNPYFITPSGNIVVCEVIGDIPYIRSDSQLSRPKAPARFKRVPMPAAPAYQACPGEHDDDGG